METRCLLLSILKDLKESDEKITVSIVAKKANVSHSLIYNHYPDILQIIRDVKKSQKLKKEKMTDAQIIVKLKKENDLLKERLSKANKDNSKRTIEILTSHIQELYSMYDALLEERNSFAERIKDL